MLSDQEKQTLDQLRQASQQRDQIPESQRKPITNPDKYAFPIGLDDQGKPLTQPANQPRSQTRSNPSKDQSTGNDSTKS
jgi:hypothetical protein